MAPEDLDRMITVAAQRYSAMTPADWRRERRETRRACRAERWRRIRTWWRRPAPEEWEDAAASFMTTPDTLI
jgi:hypothetical protein